MESPLKNNMSLASAMNVAPHSLFINHREPSYYMPFEGLSPLLFGMLKPIFPFHRVNYYTSLCNLKSLVLRSLFYSVYFLL